MLAGAFLINKKIIMGCDPFRAAAVAKIIQDPEVWFDFQEMRNLSSHVYDKTQADLIVEKFEVFSAELAKLVASLNKLI